MRHAIVITIGVAILLMALAAVPLALLAFDQHQRLARLAPPPQVTCVTTFLEWQPNTELFYVIQHSSDVHLMAIGPSRGIMASGPSAYVFDRSGNMVDWSYDIGDDPEFDRHWAAQATTRTSRAISASIVNDGILDEPPD